LQVLSLGPHQQQPLRQVVAFAPLAVEVVVGDGEGPFGDDLGL